MIKSIWNPGFVVLIVVAGALLAAGPASPVPAQDSSEAWREDWSVRRGFSIELDTSGYEFPTAMAFVPEPAGGPKDPLYFVTEIKGKIKVVTNDRTVFTFAEPSFTRQPVEELPDNAGEVGMAGICLDAKNGYVFTTFSYLDSEGILRNNVVRFESTPMTFSTQAGSQVAFTEIFSDYEGRESHQIGPCQVHEDLLYVSVGDAKQAQQSTRRDSVLGKVLRMTLDGAPTPENPFYRDDNVKNGANFVWVSGLRNPFGLKVVEDRVFIADNGRKVDRFLEAHEGEDYLWDGTDLSIGSYADVLLTDGGGAAQLDYLPPGSSDFPEDFQGSFYLAVSGNMELPRDLRQPPRVLRIDYSLEESRLTSVPSLFIEYRGNDVQAIAGLGVGQEGFYFAPLFPNSDGQSSVFRVTYDPSRQHPFILGGDEPDPVDLMRERGCFGCHSMGSIEGGSDGPVLDGQILIPRLETRLNSEDYQQAVREVDQLDREPFTTFKGARQQVLGAGGQQKVRSWLTYFLQEPRFDDPGSQMPNLGLTEGQALIIADYLLGQASGARDEASPAAAEEQEPNAPAGFAQVVIDRLKEFLPSPAGRRHLAYFFAGGFLLGAVSITCLYLIVRFVRSRAKA